MLKTDLNRLELTRGGLRFADREVESAFRDWYIGEAVPFTRLGMVASIFAWLMAWIGVGVSVPGATWDMAPWVLGLLVFIGTVLLMTYRKKPGPWMLRTTALANALAGLVLVGPILYGISGEAQAAALGFVTVAFFGFTVFRLHPVQAAVAVASYGVLHEVLMLGGYGHQELTSSQLATYSIGPLIAYSVGLLVCAIFSRMSREAYRREVVIEAQQTEIANERERAERLLRNILPEPIAERLKHSDESIADYFESVTVLFADIVGFTPLSAKLSAGDVVNVLNTVFTAFDELAERHGAEKIKTIGDAYMAVSGLPNKRSDHASVAAALALDMQAEIENLSAAVGHAISFRIGLCSGPAVAGVIGRRKFAYDLWGDTVNMAARMESHGVSGEIQVTQTTYDLLTKDGYRLEPRGKIEIKGRGETQTWFLRGHGTDKEAVRSS